jgi:hypothetical protein
MKGTLHKTEQGWMISRCVGDGLFEIWEEHVPLHPDDQNYVSLNKDIKGKNVEFEMARVINSNGKVELFAKIINKNGAKDINSVTDDEIDAAAKQMFYNNSDSGWHVQFARNCFKEGAKWYREKLKGK